MPFGTGPQSTPRSHGPAHSCQNYTNVVETIARERPDGTKKISDGKLRDTRQGGGKMEKKNYDHPNISAFVSQS